MKHIRRLFSSPVAMVMVALMVGACAIPVMSPYEITPPPLIFSDTPKLNASLGSVKVGHTTMGPSMIGHIRQALRTTLEQSGLFDQASDTTLNIVLRNLDLKSDPFGIIQNSYVTGNYVVQTRQKDVVFSTTARSTGTASPQDAISGVERSGIAARRALSLNFAAFREKLIEYFHDHTDFLPPATADSKNSPSASESTSAEAEDDGALRLVDYRTGFFVNANGFIVTVAHVVDGCRTMIIRDGGDPIALSVEAIDPVTDLAVLRSNLSTNTWLPLSTGKTLRRGNTVVTFGYPLAGALSSNGVLNDGIVSALQGMSGNSQHLQISNPVEPGSSGGPLLNVDASVVGVTVGTIDAVSMVNETGSMPQNINFAIKAQALSSFLDGASIDYTVDEIVTPKSTAEIGEIADSATVKIYCYQ